MTERGRPTDYDPEFAEIAKSMCELGATTYELAKEFGVTTSTIWRWAVQHEEFCSAIKVGKDQADERVVKSLFERAVGYTFESEKIVSYEGQVTRVPIIEHVPPDPGAAKMWLTNRRRKEWADTLQVNHTLGEMTDEQIEAELNRIANKGKGG
jgi:hypothetical protein